MVALEGSETLQLAMKQLVDTQRILVHQPDDSTRKPVYRLLTQTDVVRFLYNNISSFKDIGSKPIIELGNDCAKSQRINKLQNQAKLVTEQT